MLVMAHPLTTLRCGLRDSRLLDADVVAHEVAGGWGEGDLSGAVEPGGAFVRLDRPDGSSRVELTCDWCEPGGAHFHLEACGLLTGEGDLVVAGRVNDVVVLGEGYVDVGALDIDLFPAGGAEPRHLALVAAAS